MEVLASTNRMSATTFLSLYFISEDGTTGLAFIPTQEFLVTYCITFVLFLLCMVPFRVQLVNILRKLLRFNIFTSIFTEILCIWNIILGLYRVAHECGHSQVPMPKLHKKRREQDQPSLQSALPPKEEYLVGIQTRQTLVIEGNSSLLTPLTIDEPEWKETFQKKKQPESTTDTILEGETLISQVTPLLGTTPSENTQIQHRNTPEDISDILGTRAYKKVRGHSITDIRWHNCKPTKTVPATHRGSQENS